MAGQPRAFTLVFLFATGGFTGGLAAKYFSLKAKRPQ
jgi:hypothetical protein